MPGKTTQDYDARPKDFISEQLKTFGRGRESKHLVPDVVGTLTPPSADEMNATDRAAYFEQMWKTMPGIADDPDGRRFLQEYQKAGSPDFQHEKDLRAFFEHYLRDISPQPLTDQQIQAYTDQFLRVIRAQSAAQMAGCMTISGPFAIVTLVTIGIMFMGIAIFALMSTPGFFLEELVIGDGIIDEAIVAFMLTVFAFMVIASIIRTLRRMLSSVVGVVTLIIWIVIVGVAATLFFELEPDLESILRQVEQQIEIMGGF